jgi:hypothetical protein
MRFALRPAAALSPGAIGSIPDGMAAAVLAGHVDGPVRAFEATERVGESTRAAYLDAEPGRPGLIRTG